MGGRQQPEDPAATAACQRCNGIVQAADLQRCPWCFRYFCLTCRFPRGVADYCSRACAEAMFHGGDEEDGSEED